MFKGSWKTTLSGVGAIIGAVWMFLVSPYLDTDPATIANIAGFITAATPGVGLLMARDNNVSSEQAGAK